MSDTADTICTKCCTKCKIVKNIDEFGMGNRYRKSECRVCYALYMKKYRKRTKIERKAKFMGDDDLEEMLDDVQKIAFLLGKKLDISIS
jgi:hypothetical protein